MRARGLIQILVGLGLGLIAACRAGHVAAVCETDSACGPCERCHNGACATEPALLNACGTCGGECNVAPGCGDGVVQAPETCDSAIPAAQDGSCPTRCDDGVVCTADARSGNAATCDIVCSHSEITTCVSGDGCCPEGCTFATDSDCSRSCGNGTVDAGETCDGSCPTAASCADDKACTIDFLVGSATTCSAACAHQQISSCTSDDGCCPAGCIFSVDSDCSCRQEIRRPWEETGVRTSYVDGNVQVVISGDRYWQLDILAHSWVESGHLQRLWAGAPKVDGLKPWSGLSASYTLGNVQTIISGDRYWTLDRAGRWGAAGHLQTVWFAAPLVDGLEPWEAGGISTSYVHGTTQTIISADRYWTVDTTDGSWGASGHLHTVWAGAPAVDGLRPWEGPGVSASYVYNGVQTIISSERYWTVEVATAAWGASGHLTDVWSTAPGVDACTGELATACGDTMECGSGICESRRCRWPQSCKELHLKNGLAKDGYYTLDADGPGPQDAEDAYCDMSFDGGGWTLVGRSKPVPLNASCDGYDGGTNFGWKIATGSVYDDTAPYSMDVASAGLGFTQVLLGDFTEGKRWGHAAYRHSVASDFLAQLGISAVDNGAPVTVVGACSGPLMLRFIGYTDSTFSFYLRDMIGNAFGLTTSGFKTCYNDCDRGGELNGYQGMIFVR